MHVLTQLTNHLTNFNQSDWQIHGLIAHCIFIPIKYLIAHCKLALEVMRHLHVTSQRRLIDLECEIYLRVYSGSGVKRGRWRRSAPGTKHQGVTTTTHSYS